MDCQKHIFKNMGFGNDEMAQWVKAQSAKTDVLGFISWTNMVEEENPPCKLSSEFYILIGIHTHTHEINK